MRYSYPPASCPPGSHRSRRMPALPAAPRRRRGSAPSCRFATPGAVEGAALEPEIRVLQRIDGDVDGRGIAGLVIAFARALGRLDIPSGQRAAATLDIQE